MKSLLILSLFLLCGCGVVTDSSAVSSFSGGVADSNSSESNSSSGDVNGSIDSNSSVDSNSSGDVNSTSESKYIFDKVDATLDDNACDSALFSGIPLQDTANTARETEDKKNGLILKSLFDETVNELDSLVTLYFNSLPVGTTLLGSYSKVYGDNARFYVAYDKVWVNIENNVVYVKAPPGIFNVTQTKPSCFKLTLNKELGSDVEVLKVYR